MRLSEDELESLFRQSTKRPGADRASCLDAGTIAALTAGDLDESRRSPALDHLASCSECAEEARMLAPLDDWAARVSGPLATAPPRQVHGTDFSRVAAMTLAASLVLPLAGVAVWQWMEIGRLHQTMEHAPVVRARRTPAAPPVSPPPPDLAPLVAELEAELDRISQPQLNPLIVDLEADALRGGASANAIEVPRGAPFFNVILSAEASHPAYSLEIRDGAGELIWRGSGLKRSEYGTFTVALPTRLVPSGRYELRLYGVTGSREGLLQRYHLRITHN